MKITIELKKLNRELTRTQDALKMPRIMEPHCFTLKDLLEAEEYRIKQQIRKLRRNN